MFQDGSVRAFVVSLGFGSQGVVVWGDINETVVLCHPHLSNISPILVPIPAVVQHRLEREVQLGGYTGCVNGSRKESFTLASFQPAAPLFSRADGL